MISRWHLPLVIVVEQKTPVEAKTLAQKLLTVSQVFLTITSLH